MKVSVVSYSLSNAPLTIAEWENRLLAEIEQLAKDSDVLLYPELFLMALSDYFQGELPSQLESISDYTYNRLLPAIDQKLSGKNILLCLGSGPRLEDGRIYNTCPIRVNDCWVYQDKIHLTPWETHFAAGTEVRLFEFKGTKTASLICYDIEQPGLALFLKRAEIELLLCPSATVDRNGSQRVNRCASARAVELGCAVFTSPLVGQSGCDLIDHNEGRQGFFLPSQEAVAVEQEQFSDYSTREHSVSHYQLDETMLKELKKRDNETKPYFKEDFLIL